MLLPVAVQGDDIERHRGDMDGQALGIGQQEAQRAAEPPLALQGVYQGERQAQGVDQEVGCGHTQEVSRKVKQTVASRLGASPAWVKPTTASIQWPDLPFPDMGSFYFLYAVCWMTFFLGF